MFEKDALLTFHGGSKCPQVLAFMFIFLFFRNLQNSSIQSITTGGFEGLENLADL